MTSITIQDRLKGLLVVVALSAGWAAVLMLVLVVSGSFKAGSVAGSIVCILLVGPLMGGMLALVVHSFLGRVLDWLSARVKFFWIAVFVAIKIPYYCFAWPGIKIGEALGLVSFVPGGTAAQVNEAADQIADPSLERCPFEGMVYSNEGHSKLLYRVRPDWKVDLEHQAQWGYVDAKGQIRAYHGPNPFSLGGPSGSPYETGYDPAAPWVLADQGVIARLDGSLCLKGAYDSDVIGGLSLGNGSLF